MIRWLLDVWRGPRPDMCLTLAAVLERETAALAVEPWAYLVSARRGDGSVYTKYIDKQSPRGLVQTSLLRERVTAIAHKDDRARYAVLVLDNLDREMERAGL